MKNKIILTVLFCAIFSAILIYILSLNRKKSPVQEEVVIEPEVVTKYGIPVDSFRIEENVFQKNEFLSNVLFSLGATNEDVVNISNLDKEIFDVRSIRAGNTYKAFYPVGDTLPRSLSYFVYEKSSIDYTVFCFRDSFHVYKGRKDVEIRKKRSEAEITSSLWNAAVDNQIDINLAMTLSDIYSWTIDFFGLQKGDRFSVIYEELYVDSAYIGIGSIYAADFFHGDKSHYAFYFEQDSIGSYWDESGNSLRRSFLKAPLKFSRISSHFSYARKHPVLRIVRPHTGVDYAAPSGTPVLSIGDGVVIGKGYEGGGGNTVKIRHNSVYTSAYLHLSKFSTGLKVGSRVSQGDVIGYVGSTGLSTGPHLDFRIWMNGKAVNPLTIESPPVEPVREEYKMVFDSISTEYKKKLKIREDSIEGFEKNM